MSVFLAVYLDCNTPGCTARYVPLLPSSDTAAVRAQAALAGWLFNPRSPGEDHCPVHAQTPISDYRMPRGICQVCDVEHPLTMQAVVKAHNAPGTRRLCDGGRLHPSRITRAHGKPLDYDWRTQRGGPGRA